LTDSSLLKLKLLLWRMDFI